MSSAFWPYQTPGISDHLFERLPGIPMSQREIRLLIVSQLRLKADAVLWDIGAGTGTIPVEVGLLCPEGQIFAIERDEDVVDLIRRNCDRFNVSNVNIVMGSAPDCLKEIATTPDCICIEGGRDVKSIVLDAWKYLQSSGRIVATAQSLESLYRISEALAEVRACNIEVVQSAINRLETRGNNQVLAATNPMFVLSGEKVDSLR